MNKVTNGIGKVNKTLVFLRLNIPPNLTGCMSSCNYALILFKTFGFVAGLYMMMVYNSKSFHDFKMNEWHRFSLWLVLV